MLLELLNIVNFVLKSNPDTEPEVTSRNLRWYPPEKNQSQQEYKLPQIKTLNNKAE